MDGPIYRPSGIVSTVIRPQESHGLCVIPQPVRKKDRRKQSDQPNESPILQWDQNSIQKPVLEMQERHTTYRKIQEMVPLQDKIKEDERIRNKDSNKDKVNYQSMLIGNQSFSSSIGVNWHPLKPHMPIQQATTIIRYQNPHPFMWMPSSFHIRLITQTLHIC